MEQDTQHNARLVEQTAGFATELREQAASLAQVVSVFTLARGEQPDRAGAARPPALPHRAANAPLQRQRA